MEADKVHKENSKWELNKNFVCCFEENMKIALHKNSGCTETYLQSHE